MFLALKEMRKEKSRFAMIVLVTVLIAYLVYFLSSLSFGLAQINRTAVDYWNADGIVISASANKNIYASSIDVNEAKALNFDLANAINVTSTTAKVSSMPDQDPFNIVLIGAENTEKIAPALLEGRFAENENELVVSHSLNAKSKFKLNDTFTLASNNREFQIVGITGDANFNTVPVAYVARDMASQSMIMTNVPNSTRISAILMYGEQDANVGDYRYLSINDFINGLPGYQPQVLTFGLMIGSLSLISTLIIGIFMYILTMQKKSVFAVLKIQGYKDSYIITSVIIQTLMLTLLGFAVAFVLAYLTIVFIPASVPVAINTTLFVGITLFALISSLLGTLFSAKSVLRIDPLEAL